MIHTDKAATGAAHTRTEAVVFLKLTAYPLLLLLLLLLLLVTPLLCLLLLLLLLLRNLLLLGLQHLAHWLAASKLACVGATDISQANLVLLLLLLLLLLLHRC
jgi:hypothetical protein